FQGLPNEQRSDIGISAILRESSGVKAPYHGQDRAQKRLPGHKAKPSGRIHDSCDALDSGTLTIRHGLTLSTIATTKAKGARTPTSPTAPFYFLFFLALANFSKWV